eukprot:6244542-Prymnesium_polylepis.1
MRARAASTTQREEQRRRAGDATQPRSTLTPAHSIEHGARAHRIGAHVGGGCADGRLLHRWRFNSALPLPHAPAPGADCVKSAHVGRGPWVARHPPLAGGVARTCGSRRWRRRRLDGDGCDGGDDSEDHDWGAHRGRHRSNLARAC